jgi:hypothetical protein
VKLSYHWSPPGAGDSGSHAGNRTLLRRPVAPGERVILERVEVQTPETPGPYLLDFELVNEFVAWFRDRGATVLSVPVTVD